MHDSISSLHWQKLQHKIQFLLCSHWKMQIPSNYNLALYPLDTASREMAHLQLHFSTSWVLAVSCGLSTVFTLVQILFSQTICHGMKDIKGSTDMTSKLSRCQHNLYAQKSHRYQVNKAFKFIIIWQKICITTNFFNKFLVVSRERKQMEVVKKGQ